MSLLIKHVFIYITHGLCFYFIPESCLPENTYFFPRALRVVPLLQDSSPLWIGWPQTCSSVCYYDGDCWREAGSLNKLRPNWLNGLFEISPMFCSDPVWSLCSWFWCLWDGTSSVFISNVVHHQNADELWSHSSPGNASLIPIWILFAVVWAHFSMLKKYLYVRDQRGIIALKWTSFSAGQSNYSNCSSRHFQGPAAAVIEHSEAVISNGE